MTEKQALTREEYKKLKLAEQKQAAEHVETPTRTGLIPMWLRFVIFIALIIICVTAGALVGYSGIGGGKAVDVFKGSTWSHIYDLVEKK
ncbi:DNA-directed RNA polymerase subunit beta [Bacillus sp. EB600]|uniref:DNA-directed RNA polymerase subunit beta n=1 Tax=Bacillus sp. EB600 TaxID=2806345 RepID=UPI0021094F79|nr:DNA-directed RNA polymerase subunit beta [Bacillus sp. EB600]MCQ6279922.1 DNA-directed RNA polymerase subunit beta [Bacillus sp. EB600]